MDLLVIDTSSIIEIRRAVPGSEQPGVYRKLSALVDAGTLLYPKQVVSELEEYTGSTKNKPDLPHEWVKRNDAQATREGFDADNLASILQSETIRRVIDPDKSGKDEADPYVLELATRLRNEGHTVTVITEDRIDKPYKLSLRSACGVLGIPAIGVELLLETRGIWRKP